jgi:hypothetical protein
MTHLEYEVFSSLLRRVLTDVVASKYNQKHFIYEKYRTV